MKVRVQVAGRELALSNLDKVLYPETGFTKAEVIDYYSRIAPVLLPHVRGRPLTVKRYPNGVTGPHFFEKNAPRHTPPWIRRATLPVPGSTKNRQTIDFAVIDDLPTLIYYANLAALELHVPMWQVSPEGTALPPDILVFDLDPGAPATIVECCQVALLLRDALAKDDLECRPKTSGNKGMQLHVPWPYPDRETSGYARELAQRLDAGHELVTSVMTRRERPGKVFIDWSQNNPAKTTVAAYSLRANAAPTVSTPLSWEEVEGCDNPAQLVFTAPDVLARVEEFGDLFL
ncbi:non-homologous end-joining DNA ligase [Acrocarpospora catenulata]|uniref:non-homologous end-joining DNA ligase n=1 Tax=Acrocarpospora catenulata TaxID=2836182 RepID=UPI0027E1A81F|nr:non-homologous end-joining DNA ligase [Acrocarpospora catenulata]